VTGFALRSDVAKWSPFSTDASVAMTADAVYVATASGIDTPTRLWRLDKLDLSEQLIADDIPAFSQVAVFDGRVYLYSWESFWSGTESGSFVDEGFPIGSITSSAGVVYADRAGTLIARKEGESAWTPQPWLVSEDNVRLWPVDVSDRLCVLRESWGASQTIYDLYRVDEPTSPDGGLVALASGAGELVRLRSQDGFLYWLVREESGLLQLLRRDIERRGPLQLLATGGDLLDFALDSSAVYLTRSAGSLYEIEVISTLAIGERPELGLRFEAISPEADGEHFWFLQWDALQRVELRADELL
jgi:hypothetical protein